MKRKRIESDAILKAARGENCTISVPGVCRNETHTVVACHSNWHEDGKGMGIKAEDIFVAFGCWRCHNYIDDKNRDASTDEKRDLFHRGMKKTLIRLIEKGVINIKGFEL